MEDRREYEVTDWAGVEWRVEEGEREERGKKRENRIVSLEERSRGKRRLFYPARWIFPSLEVKDYY